MQMLNLPKGTYIVAVSGGVDSVALLHQLVQTYKKPKVASEISGTPVRLIVAHFDHGIRPDSAEDRRLVQQLARHYGLPFIYERAALGEGASETTARKARYDFLHRTRQASGAQAVITAHHEDDVVETILLNMLRGTGGRGLHSLQSRYQVQRPLLAVSKKEVLRYAQSNGLIWREDSTNANEAIMRNYLRKNYVANMAKTHRSMLLKRSKRAAELSAEIDEIIANYLHVQPSMHQLNRGSFIGLPHVVAREVMASWLRCRAVEVEINRRLLERLVVAAKVGRNGSRVDVMNGWRLVLSADTVELVRV